MRSKCWSKAGEHDSELKIQDPAGRIGDCRSRGSLVMIVVDISRQFQKKILGSTSQSPLLFYC